MEALLGRSDIDTGELMAPVAEAMEGPPPPDACGPYALRREVGRGGMGVVYEAIDTRTDAQVAVKVIHPNLAMAPRFHERFDREARMGRAVKHENVVRTLDAGFFEHGEHTLHSLAMEYAEGKNLRELLDELGTVPETLLREIALQASAGRPAARARRRISSRRTTCAAASRRPRCNGSMRRSTISRTATCTSRRST